MARQCECATSGVCLALAFAEQLASFGDVHGLLFGVRPALAPVLCPPAARRRLTCSCRGSTSAPAPQVEKEETRTVITDTGSKEVIHTTIDIQVHLRRNASPCSRPVRATPCCRALALTHQVFRPMQVFAQHAFFDGNGKVDAAVVAACVEKYPQVLECAGIPKWCCL